MKHHKTNPQFLLDDSGRKKFVVLSVREYEEILQDLHDIAVVAERRDEPKMSLTALEEALKADGIL
jgi:hypothetical protein